MESWKAGKLESWKSMPLIIDGITYCHFPDVWGPRYVISVITSFFASFFVTKITYRRTSGPCLQTVRLESQAFLQIKRKSCLPSAFEIDCVKQASTNRLHY